MDNMITIPHLHQNDFIILCTNALADAKLRPLWNQNPLNTSMST